MDRQFEFDRQQVRIMEDFRDRLDFERFAPAPDCTPVVTEHNDDSQTESDSDS